MRFILFFLILLMSEGNFAQNIYTDSTVALIAYWSEGDVKQYTIHSSRTDYKDGTLEIEEKSTYHVTITVLEETLSSYTLSWKIRMNDEDLDDPFCSIINGLDIHYKTDELGAFLKVLNIDDVRSAMSSAFNDVKSKLKKVSSNEMAIKELERTFSQREAIEQVLMKDVQLYHMAFGFEYFLEQKGIYESEIPNIFGGDPYPGIMEMVAIDLNKMDKTCKIIIDQYMDKEKAALLLTETLDDLSKNSTPTFDIKQFEDHNEFRPVLTTGWLDRAYHQRTVEINDLKRVDTMEISAE